MKYKALAAKCDERYGMPPIEVIEKLQKEYKEIKAVNSYQDFYKRLKLPVSSVLSSVFSIQKAPTDDDMCAMLRQAVKNSADRHYHGGREMHVHDPEEYLKVCFF